MAKAGLMAGSLVIVAAVAARAEAQVPVASAAPLRCRGEIVSRIDVQSLPPFTPQGDRWYDRVAHRAAELHSTTKEPVIRRFLALKEGSPCTELRRRDSERILRAQPFLASASVTAYPDGRGGVTLSVLTIDEVSLILGGSASLKAPVVRGFRVGEANLHGEGIYVVGSWRSSQLFRDVFSGKVVDYQFLGKPYQATAEGTRNELGGSWNTELAHPYLTDLQRIAWRTTAGGVESYQRLLRPSGDNVAMQFTRTYGDVGGVIRLGPTGRLFLVGGSVSRELERPAYTPVVIVGDTPVPELGTALTGRYESLNTTRLNALLGYRQVRFMKVNGFDALRGTQDVRAGIEVATLFGRGIQAFRRDESDYFVSGSLYAGAGNPTSFVAVETIGERRRSLDEKRWDGILMSGRAAWYMKPGTQRQTIVSSVEYSAGVGQRIPFQLSFADRDGGLRGFKGSRTAGGRRLVTRLEDRYVLGNFKQFAAVGLAGFVDAGKLWAGDAPFGVNSGVAVSAGVGLLVALPPRSRRTWRMDVAFPVSGGGGGDGRARRVEVRVTNRDFTRWFWREPRDVRVGRERSVPTNVYNWP